MLQNPHRLSLWVALFALVVAVAALWCRLTGPKAKRTTILLPIERYEELERDAARAKVLTAGVQNINWAIDQIRSRK